MRNLVSAFFDLFTLSDPVITLVVSRMTANGALAVFEDLVDHELIQTAFAKPWVVNDAFTLNRRLTRHTPLHTTCNSTRWKTFGNASCAKFSALHDGKDFLHEGVKLNVAQACIPMNEFVVARLDAILVGACTTQDATDELQSECGCADIKPGFEHSLALPTEILSKAVHCLSIAVHAREEMRKVSEG